MTDQYVLNDEGWIDAWNGNEAITAETPRSWQHSAETWSSEIMASRLGWCGCVVPGDLLASVEDYLRGVWGSYGDTIINFHRDDMGQTLIAMSLDAAGFTDHGESIGGSWLTEAGVGWLALVDAERTFASDP